MITLLTATILEIYPDDKKEGFYRAKAFQEGSDLIKISGIPEKDLPQLKKGENAKIYIETFVFNSKENSRGYLVNRYVGVGK